MTLTRTVVGSAVRRVLIGNRNSVVPCGEAPRAARKAFRNVHLEQSIEGLSQGVGTCDAVKPLERLIPANDPVVEPDNHQPVVERLEDVLVECSQAIELGRLDVQLPVEPPVFDGRGGLRRDREEQAKIFARQWLAGAAAAQGKDRVYRFVRQARHQVIDACVAPHFDLFGGEAPGSQRIVEAHHVASRQPSSDA